MPSKAAAQRRRFDPQGQLVVVLGYVLLSWIGFVLVLPPFYNNVVWLADGFALGLMLAWGRHLWPGVLVGALLSNLVVVSPALSTTQAAMPILVTVLVASLGVTSQLWLSSWILERQLRRGLDYYGREIVRFLIVAGPLGVAWGTSIGLGAYTGLGLFDASEYWNRWANWYAAGVIGMVTLCPVVYLWASPLDDSPAHRKLGMTGAILSVLVVIASVLYLLRSQENDRVSLSLSSEAQAMGMSLSQFMAAQADLLEVAKLHFESNPFVHRESFERFGRRLLENNHTIVNMVWLPRVPQDERRAMEARLSEELGRDVVFRRADGDLSPLMAGSQPVYYPIFYALGRGRFGDFVGTDWAYAPALGPIVSRSTLVNTQVLTAPFPIPRQADGAISTFLLQITPVQVLDCETHRPGLENPCIRGLVAFIAAAEQLVPAVWPEAFLQHFDVALEDVGASRPIFHSQPREPLMSHFSESMVLQVLDREWHLVVTPTAAYAASFRSSDTWFLIALLALFCITIVWILLYASSAHSRVEQEVRLKTAQLAEAVVDAQRANRAKSEFLANMSHELRTPLNSIIGFTRRVLGRESTLSERARDALETVDRNGQHLLNLINDLLDVSRIEAGKLKVLREPVALPELIDDVLVQMEPQAASRELALKRDLPADLPEVMGDRTRITQILLNLMSNAIKFTEKGHIEIKAAVVQKEQRRGVAISVVDTGIGIAEEDLGRLFRRYTQLNEGSRPGLEGSGLGLVLVRELAALQGGDITVESQLGRGSVFTVWLPAVN